MPTDRELIAALQRRTQIPDTTNVAAGSRLTVDDNGSVAWIGDPDDELVHFSGDPNGEVAAPRGTIGIDDASGDVWHNTDGLDTWEAVGGGLTIVAGTGITVDNTDPANPIVATNGEDPYNNKGDVSGSVTVTLADAPVQRIRLTGNITTLTLAGSTSGLACDLTLYIVQDGTGSRTITWPSSVKWPNGIPPILSTAAGAIDIVVLETFDGGTTWFANMTGKAYA